MKKLMSLILALSLLTGLSACHFANSDKEPVEFFYLRSSDAFIYGAEDGVITSETRESSGHVGDLNYLLPLYLRGPLDTELESPFPAGCRIVEIIQDDKTLRLTLDATFAQLEDLDLTLACACLARTCFGMTNAQEIRIDAAAPDGNSTVNITMNRNSLLLVEDNTIPQQAVTE